MIPLGTERCEIRDKLSITEDADLVKLLVDYWFYVPLSHESAAYVNEKILEKARALP